MRLPLVIASVLALAAPVSGQTQSWTADYNRLLAKYATPNGVKYSEWKSNAADMQALQAVVDGIAKENVGSQNQKDQLAYYVNAYNAWILHEALGKYPVKSVKDALFTFFTAKRIKVAGSETSFNALEKETIRSKFNDPRVHFALNCASRSCPPLLADAFRGDKLDAQFEKLAKGFVNSERGVRGDGGRVELSKIFDWYKDDFAKDGGAVAFINKRRTDPLPADAKISYQDYDWGLNEAK
ncbi:MAG: DUF547 domain-containing protein [Chthoniobacterales bacterium]|nr:DUF547 domain-containing protein [Chthoniobacterales bacterium]